MNATLMKKLFLNARLVHIEKVVSPAALVVAAVFAVAGGGLSDD